jgi:hypothetical protein
MSKFKKNQIYLQGFVYLSCATCTVVCNNCEASDFMEFSLKIQKVILNVGINRNKSSKLLKAVKR